EVAMLDEAVIHRTLDTALRAGAGFAELFVEDVRATSASLDDGRVEDVVTGRDRGAGVRVVVGETTGFAHTADLSEAGLLAAARAASAVAARSPDGTVRRLELGPNGGVAREGVADVDPATIAKAVKVGL